MREHTKPRAFSQCLTENDEAFPKVVSFSEDNSEPAEPVVQGEESVNEDFDIKNKVLKAISRCIDRFLPLVEMTATAFSVNHSFSRRMSIEHLSSNKLRKTQQPDSLQSKHLKVTFGEHS